MCGKVVKGMQQLGINKCNSRAANGNHMFRKTEQLQTSKALKRRKESLDANIIITYSVYRIVGCCVTVVAAKQTSNFAVHLI